MTQRVTQTVKLVDRSPDADTRVTQVVKLVDRQPNALLRVTQVVMLIDRGVAVDPPPTGNRRAAFF